MGGKSEKHKKAIDELNKYTSPKDLFYLKKETGFYNWQECPLKALVNDDVGDLHQQDIVTIEKVVVFNDDLETYGLVKGSYYPIRIFEPIEGEIKDEKDTG